MLFWFKIQEHFLQGNLHDKNHVYCICVIFTVHTILQISLLLYCTQYVRCNMHVTILNSAIPVCSVQCVLTNIYPYMCFTTFTVYTVLSVLQNMCCTLYSSVVSNRLAIKILLLYIWVGVSPALFLLTPGTRKYW